MERWILPRMGAVCGILYVVLILVGNSVYESGNETVGLPMELAGMIHLSIIVHLSSLRSSHIKILISAQTAKARSPAV